MATDRSRQALGGFGERLAAEWYEARGFEIVERNWRVREGEIDLIVRNDLTLVFCEVKTRRSDRFGSGAESVTATKQQRIRKLAAMYLASGTHRGSHSIRFDVASVSPDGVDVIENAF